MLRLISNCRRDKFGVFAAFGLALTLFAPIGAAAEQIGVAVTVRNDVTGKIQAETVRIGNGADVFGKEIVRTNPDSSAQIVLKDNTNLNVGPNSTITLDNFVFNGDSDYKKATFGVAKGALRFASGQSDKRAYDMKTPTSTIGVRGTDYALETGERMVPATGGKPAHVEKYTHLEVSHGTVVACPKNSKENANDVDVSGNDQRKKRQCDCNEVHENEAVDITDACVFQSQFTGQTSQMACGGACSAPMSYSAATTAATMGSTLPALGIGAVVAGATAGAVISSVNNSNNNNNNNNDWVHTHNILVGSSPDSQE
jgi:hypothetical protein